MSNRNLAFLVILTAAVVVLTAFLHVEGKKDAPPAVAGTYLIQGLDPDSISKITIEGKDDAVNLVRRGDGFVVAEKKDYPASNKVINELIIKSLDIRVDQKITENVENHADLGVAEDSEDAVSVTFIGADDKPLVGYIKSKSDEESGGFYLRPVGNDTVYRSGNYLWLQTRPIDYVDREILSVTKSDIEQVDIAVGEEKYTIAKDESDKVSLGSIPEGKKVKDSEHENVFHALSSLRISDVLPADELDLEWDGKYVCRLKSGLIYTVSSAEKDGKTYVRLSAQAPKPGRIEIGKEDSDEELKEKEAMILAAETAAEIGETHGEWIYEIPSSAAKKLRKPFAELIEDIEPEAEDDETAEEGEPEAADDMRPKAAEEATP